MTSEKPPYEVLFRSHQRRALRTLRADQREKVVDFLENHAARAPYEPIPGKTKRLAGPFRQMIQFDIDEGYRLIYSVDDEAHAVVVEYVGPHPDWGKSARAGRITR